MVSYFCKQMGCYIYIGVFRSIDKDSKIVPDAENDIVPADEFLQEMP